MSKLKSLVLTLLRQGTQPRELSLTLSLGFLLATFPVLGSTTFLCALAAWALRLNLPLIMLVNYLAYPVQLAIYVPLLLLGASILDPTLTSLTLSGVYDMLRADLTAAIARLFWANLGATLIWGAAAIPFGFLLYSLTHRLMRHWRQSPQTEP
jgi:uncharacterized protein (DUF2062 family)